MGIVIRNEGQSDYRLVEEITRKSFWNIYVPGCDEHYLVHIMRDHPDFIKELDFVIEVDGKVVGNIMYTRSRLNGLDNRVLEIATFGPVSILPDYQRRGLGKALLSYSMSRAEEMGIGAIVIFGNPCNYVGVGFKSASRYRIGTIDGQYPSAMLAKELKSGFIEAGSWSFQESDVYSIDHSKFESYDSTFEYLPKLVSEYQEEFHILSHSRIIIEK